MNKVTEHAHIAICFVSPVILALALRSSFRLSPMFFIFIKKKFFLN